MRLIVTVGWVSTAKPKNPGSARPHSLIGPASGTSTVVCVATIALGFATLSADLLNYAA